MLVGSAELEEVRSFDPGKVVADQVLLAIPEPGADTLCIQVVGGQQTARGLTLGLQRPAQTGQLRLLGHSRPSWSLPSRKIACPVIAQITVVEVVGQITGNIGR